MMGLEAGSFINDLNSANPVAGDPRNEGDDHLRLLKSVIKATFPNMAGRFHRTQVKSANYTAVANDESSILSIDTTGVTIALTAAATLGNGWSVLVYADGFDVTIDPNGAETINNAATLVIPNGQLALVICTGTEFVGALFVNSNYVAKTSTTGSAKIPVGTTAQRDGSPAEGYLRVNSTTGSLEVYIGGDWQSAGQGATGGGTDRVFVENDQTVNSDYTIPVGRNAHSVGPITIASGATVTVSTGSRWRID